MSYLVLARKYRSQSFDEIVCQDHVTRTLQNAIEAGRVAHAILFTGPRGTGKTSIARILAKAMNCGDHATPSPCNECRSCKEITSGHAADVIEIDGASNNSVDQIRELRETIGYMPAHSRYKIYIIDEVHMLSVAAFNALLKTLEEPPEHVLFFFATTEPHKIPVTILSRCQRHDLRRVGLADLVGHLDFICRSEKIALTREALELVAREADGSVRDSLSLLDRVIASLPPEGGTDHNVVTILGIADRNRLTRITRSLLEGKTGEVLKEIQSLHDAGIDLRKFHHDLCLQFRNLLVVQAGVESCEDLMDLPAHAVRELEAIARLATGSFLSRVLELLMEGETTLRYAGSPRIALETLLLKVLRMQPVLSVDTLIQRLGALRKDLHAGDLPEAVIIREPRLPEPECRPEPEKPAETPPVPSQVIPAPSTKPEIQSQRPAAEVREPSPPEPSGGPEIASSQPEPITESTEVQPEPRQETPSARTERTPQNPTPSAPYPRMPEAEAPGENITGPCPEPVPTPAPESATRPTPAPVKPEASQPSATPDMPERVSEPPAEYAAMPPMEEEPPPVYEGMEALPAAPAPKPDAMAPPSPIRQAPESVPPVENPLPPPITEPAGQNTTTHSNSEEKWNSVLTALRRTSPVLGDLFRTKSTLKKATDQSIELEVSGMGYHIAKFRNDKTKRQVESLIQKVFGAPLSLVIHAEETASGDVLKKQSEREQLRNQALTHPLVTEALAMFQGKVEDVRILKEDI